MMPIRPTVRCIMPLASRVATWLVHSVGALLLIGVTYAQAQNAEDVINFFNAVMRTAVIEQSKAAWNKLPQNEIDCIEHRLRQQGDSAQHLMEHGITPSDPSLSGIRLSCRAPTALPPPVKPATLPAPERDFADRQDVSAKPTFDCTKAISPTARIICLDQDGAKADWDLISAYWARSFSLVGNARDRFQQAHDGWFPALKRRCGLEAEQSNFSAGQRQCVLTAYRRQAQSYRSQLRGDALAESTLSPERHLEIQRALIARNLLDSDADGAFGPMTRTAIKRFQVQSGFPESEFLTPQQRQALLETGSRRAEPDSRDSAPPRSPEEARTQCGSSDITRRLTGCTVVINAKGYGSRVDLANAFDGRCWAYNDLQEYHRGLADCKASIAINPRSSYAYNNLGTSFLGLGDITHAISALNKSIELKPNFIYSHFNRARAFAALGNKDLARKDYEAILMIDPGNQDALDAVDALDNPPASGGDERPLPTPPPPPPPRETAKLKEARFFLDDMRKFISEESAALPIPAIAKEAANLQLALNIFDEANALRSMKQLSDLMKPFSGFEQFMKNREAARQREYALQLKQARDESAKNIYFIDSYLKANLGDPKTSALMRLREQIDDSTKTESIDEIEKTNTGLQDYIKRSHLEDSYDAIVKNLRTAPTEPPKSPVNIVSDKSKFVTEGSADDIILLYNVSPSAPNVWTNVRGDVVFQGDNASLCFSQPAPDVAMVRYIERMVRQQGARKLTSGPHPCDLSRVPSSIDIIAFQRGALLTDKNQILQLVKLIEDDVFRKYQIVNAYSSIVQRRETFSLQLESNVERGELKGYGVLAVSESPTACIIPPSKPEQVDGLRELLARNRDLIAPNLTSEWQFVETTSDLAFRGLQRRQCGYVSGDSDSLRVLVQALRREDRKYSFSPVWFEMQDLEQATFDVSDTRKQEILKRDESERKLKEEELLQEQRRKDKQMEKSTIERQLREKNGVKARALMVGINDYAKAIAEKRSDGDDRFSRYESWLKGRSADRWETFNVTSDVVDFGVVQWKGRNLDAIIVKSVIQQKNRILGAYDNGCFMFALVDDVEFRMQRDLISITCDHGERATRNWKVGKNFRSQWNAE